MKVVDNQIVEFYYREAKEIDEKTKSIEWKKLS